LGRAKGIRLILAVFKIYVSIISVNIPAIYHHRVTRDHLISSYSVMYKIKTAMTAKRFVCTSKYPRFRI